MAGVTLKDVKKIYPNGFKAIHGIDVDIQDGEFIVLVGPSGCGKSTLLRMIAGLEGISTGSVSIGGLIVNDLAPAERDIAMVFQNYALYPHMKVYDNMAYGLKIKGLSKPEIEKTVRQAAGILELTDEQLVRKPGELSGGQRQRVAIGRAIVRQPSVFLFDEPLSNLDAKLRVQMRLEIKKLQSRLNVTSIYVTHDQVEAMTLGHRLLVLNGGVLEQLGTPIEVYDKPSCVFVAEFIGSPSMNLITANISSSGDAVEIPGGETLLIGPDNSSQDPGRPVLLGVRPEHFEIVKNDEQKETMHLVVNLVELLGADTLVHGHFENEATELTIRLEGTQNFNVNERLPLTVAACNIHLFDPATERRIN